MGQFPAYWAPDVPPSEAKDSSVFAEIQHAGPWVYQSHPAGGTLATMDCGTRLPDDYGAPVYLADGLHYLPPLTLPTLYDCARPEAAGGVVVRLSCGVQAEIPVALVSHRQLRLSRRPGPRMGPPVTEYGRLAAALLDEAKISGGLMDDDPRLSRLLTLALAQRYRVTAEMVDDMGLIAAEDVDCLLGAIWAGDPKAGAPASVGTNSA